MGITTSHYKTSQQWYREKENHHTKMVDHLTKLGCWTKEYT